MRALARARACVCMCNTPSPFSPILTIRDLQLGEGSVKRNVSRKPDDGKELITCRRLRVAAMMMTVGRAGQGRAGQGRARLGRACRHDFLHCRASPWHELSGEETKATDPDGGAEAIKGGRDNLSHTETTRSCGLQRSTCTTQTKRKPRHAPT